MADEQVVFETIELRVMRSIEHALRAAKVAHRLDLPKANVRALGKNKPTLRAYVAAEDFEAARELVERALIRFGRVRSLQPKPERIEETARMPMYMPIIWMGI